MLAFEKPAMFQMLAECRSFLRSPGFEHFVGSLRQATSSGRFFCTTCGPNFPKAVAAAKRPAGSFSFKAMRGASCEPVERER